MLTEEKFVQTYGDIEVLFEPEGHTYHLAMPDGSPTEVPPVSSIVEYLPKYGLTGWYEKEAVKGCQELLRRGVRNGKGDWAGDVVPVDITRVGIDDPDFTIGLYKKMGMGAEAIRDKKAMLGTNVHAAFRGWIVNGVKPDPSNYDDKETRGYIASLALLAEDLGRVEVICCEQPLVSAQYGFAGTPDLFCRFKNSVKLQTGGNRGPGKRPKFETFEAGHAPLLDLKTSAQVYLSHSYQLTAYELMLQECGFGTPDDRWIVLIKPDGAGYNVRPQPNKLGGFLGCLAIYEAEKRPEGWRGRRVTA